jgi:branched-chain amino acid transport system ATP-binding protein
MGFHARYKQPKWKDFWHTKAARDENEVVKHEVMEILEFWGLASLRDELAHNLPHGSQRALGICIALATKPKLILLDEPFTGMTPTETANMMEKVRQLRDRGITVVTVEHNMRAIMGLSERIVVLNFGRKIAEGSPQEIRDNVEVVEAYIGKEEKHAA